MDASYFNFAPKFQQNGFLPPPILHFWTKIFLTRRGCSDNCPTTQNLRRKGEITLFCLPGHHCHWGWVSVPGRGQGGLTNEGYVQRGGAAQYSRQETVRPSVRLSVTAARCPAPRRVTVHIKRWLPHNQTHVHDTAAVQWMPFATKFNAKLPDTLWQ